MDALFRPQGGVPFAPALYAAAHSDTAYLTDRALAQLDTRKAAPWFAQLAYIRPHPPFVAPAPYHALIEPETLPPPAAAAPAHPSLTAAREGRAAAGMIWGFDSALATLSAATVARIRATCLGLVEELDVHVGRLKAWPAETGQDARTLVVVTADHGEMLGDGGLWGKQVVGPAAFRIPLMVRAPGAAPSMVDAPTESVDVAPTVLDLIGDGAPGWMDGRSPAPWLRGWTPPWRDAALMELELGDHAAQTLHQRRLGLAAHEARMTMLRGADWSYVHFAGDAPPLRFDRRDDPEELQDRAAEPACAPVRLAMAEALPRRRAESRAIWF